MTSISGHWRPSPRALPQGVAHSHSTYQPRDTEHSVLHAVIREHLEPFPSPLVSWVRNKDKIPLRFP